MLTRALSTRTEPLCVSDRQSAESDIETTNETDIETYQARLLFDGCCAYSLKHAHQPVVTHVFSQAHNPFLPLPLFALLKPLLRSLPVNNIPDRAEILRLPVLILQIVRMLPRVNPQQRPVLSHDRVLIGIGAHGNRARLRILNQPRPS